jgi:hypothetical protein|tara:strand:+ start:36 stop:185 length:150 start_codon:yes stop_codon:yes gene_type:complete
MELNSIPAHQLLVDEVFGDFITGKALAGEYGETDMILVLRVLSGSREGL